MIKHLPGDHDNTITLCPGFCHRAASLDSRNMMVHRVNRNTYCGFSHSISVDFSKVAISWLNLQVVARVYSSTTRSACPAKRMVLWPSTLHSWINKFASLKRAKTERFGFSGLCNGLVITQGLDPGFGIPAMLKRISWFGVIKSSKYMYM